jgi:hypothetical protein
MLLLVGAGFSAVMSHGPIRLVTVGLLSFPDSNLSVVVYIGSFTKWAYCLGLYVTHGLLAKQWIPGLF